MKILNRSIAFVLLAAMVTLLPVSYLKAEKVPASVNAHAYVVLDANSGEVLFEENEETRIYPASTVKIMTAIIALEHCSTSKKITIKKTILSQIPKDVYQLNLKAGDRYSLKDLLHMLLLNSAADAADSIAVGVSGSKKAFIKRMNKKAKELGMTNTKFDNTIGLDIGNNYKNTYTTAKDMAILTRYAMANVTFRTIVKKAKYTVLKTKKSKAIKLENTNQFLQETPYKKDLYTIIGTKTGTTIAAGKVLITTAKDKKGHEVICAFFGNNTKEKLYNDIRTLLNYAFEQNKKGKLELSKGFYDTRFRKAETIIRNYYNLGLLKGKSGKFYPTSKVSQGDFVETVNKIAKTNLFAISEDRNIRVKDLIKILKVAERNVEGILPEKYTAKVNAYITKEDMVIIADNLLNQVN